MENRLLEGKNAIITGARSGIGLSTLELFAKNGCNCWAVVHRDDDEFIKRVQQLEVECCVWIKPVHIDLSNSDSIKEGVKGILKEKAGIQFAGADLYDGSGLSSYNLITVSTMLQVLKYIKNNDFYIYINNP